VLRTFRKTLSRLFDEDPFWFLIVFFILLQIGSCSVRNIYCDWNTCDPKEPEISIKIGDGEII